MTTKQMILLEGIMLAIMGVASMVGAILISSIGWTIFFGLYAVAFLITSGVLIGAYKYEKK